MEANGTAYALFGKAVRNDMEVKFGGREALHQAMEEQRAAAVQSQAVETLADGEEVSAEILSELSEDVRERLLRMVISRMWQESDPREKQPFLDEGAKSAAAPEIPAADDAADAANDLDAAGAAAGAEGDAEGDAGVDAESDADADDEEGSDTMIGVSRRKSVKRAQVSTPQDMSPGEQPVLGKEMESDMEFGMDTDGDKSEKSEKSEKRREKEKKEKEKEKEKDRAEVGHKKKRLEKEGASRGSSSASGARTRPSTQALVDTEGEEEESPMKASSVASKPASKPASKRKSASTAAAESKRQAGSGSSTRGKAAKESSSSKKKRKQHGGSKASRRGRDRSSSGGKVDSARASDQELAELLAPLGLKHGEKEWIQVEWVVQKTGKDADEWMQWFNASVDLRKPVGVDKEDRPKWMIHYSRCGTLAATKSKVSFVSREHLLDDFDSEPMNWRMKQDELQETVPQLKRSSSVAGSTSSSSANDREAEWRDDLGTKPRTRR